MTSDAQLPRTCLLVLGMHRSGTSAISRVLGLLGCDMPESLMGANEFNEKGYWESSKISDLNDRILESANSVWHDWTEISESWFESDRARAFAEEAATLLEQEFGNSQLFVLKDPRICRLYPFWSRVLRELDIAPRVIIPVRNPLEVATSLQKRDGIDLAHGQLIWLRHLLDAESYTQGVRRVFCSYEELLSAWWLLVEKISKSLEVTWPNELKTVNDSVNDFLNGDLKHHSRSNAAVLDNPFAAEWYKRTFSIVSSWVEHGERVEDQEILNGIRGELTDSGYHFADLVKSNFERYLAAQAREVDVERTAKSLELRRAELDRKSSEVRNVRAERDGLRAERDGVRAELDRKKAEIANVRADNGNLRQQLAVLRSQLDGKDFRVDALGADLVALTQKNLAADVRLNEKNDEVDALAQIVLSQLTENEELHRLRSALDYCLGAEPFTSKKSGTALLQALSAHLEESGLFSSSRYRERYPDVVEANFHPFTHFVRHGFDEGRSSFGISAPTSELLAMSDEDKELIENSVYFDPNWYADEYPDVTSSGLSPLEHYVTIGRRLRRNPSGLFHTRTYTEKYPDVEKAGFDPLLHYLKHGQFENRTEGVTSPQAFWDHGQIPQVHAKSLEQLFAFRSPVPTNLIDGGLRATARAIAERSSKKVSVIIPTWNREDLVGRALRSAFGQSVQPYEVVLADDGSEDGTLDRVREEFSAQLEDGRLQIIENPHRGVCFARNSAMKRASGDWFAYLDSDNTWDRDHLLWALAFLEENPFVGACYTALLHQNLDSGAERLLAKQFEMRSLLASNFIDLNSYLHSRALYDELGGFDGNLTRLVDWELAIRYSQVFAPTLIPIVTVDYEVSSTRSSVTRDMPLDDNVDRIRMKHRELFEQWGLPSGGTPRARFFVVLDEDDLGRSSTLEVFDEFDRLDTAFEIISSENLSDDDALPGCYWYPDLRAHLPTVEELRQMVLSVLWGDIDLAILSYDLDSGDTVATVSDRNQMAVSSRALPQLLSGNVTLTPEMTGKIIRAPYRKYPDAVARPLIEIVPDVELSAQDYFFAPRDEAFAPPAPKPNRRLRFQKKRPVILTVPMKLAVGGVERNTVEVMRSLKEDFDFVYLTTERISTAQGSIAGQVSEVATRIVDMAEATSHDNYLPWLRAIKRDYKPDLVWISNGSMWLCENAAKVRKVFAGTPIFDQQVYDTERGWINRYHEPGIQSFDHFVAINSKIHSKFVEELNIPEDRVSLIYSVIDSQRFIDFKESDYSIEDLRTGFGLPHEKKIYAFMGRLVDQKRPLDFLRLAEASAANEDEFFVLVGNGVMAGECEAFIKEKGLENVLWIKNVADTAPFWACIDGLIVTSEYEGLPIVVLEALSMGKPVLATDCGDIRLVIEGHGAGEIFTSTDLDVMLNELRGWSSRNDSYQAHLEAESQNVADRFSSETISKQYADCWERLIGQEK